MRTGAAISGSLHAAFVALAIFGVDWFSEQDPIPFTVTEIELVNGQDFEAALSTAPVAPSDGPAELAPPGEGQSAPDLPDQPQDAATPSDLPVLAQGPAPEPRPDRPVLQRTPPPTPVPSEPALPTIAEIPSPDALDRQATEPESPAATEPVMPLQTMTPPRPSEKPTAPPEVEPEPEPVEQEPEPQPQAPDPTATAEREPEPEPQPDPEPDTLAQTQPDAPQGLAPQQALLPVAKPADLAAAARAASEATAAPEAQPQTEPTEPQPTQQAGGAQTTLAQRLTRGERNAMRLAIKPYYTYSGDRSDPNLEVIVRVQLREDGTIIGKPEQRSAKGGNANSQRALFQAGQRALIRAGRAGEFQRLPVDKYERWKILNFRFSVDSIGDVS